MHVAVLLPGPLREHVDGRRRLDLEVDGDASVRDVFDQLAVAYPLLERRIRDESARVREHVNVFLGSDNIKDLNGLDTTVTPGAELTILPAVSGG